jgi:hypothetical protein
MAFRRSLAAGLMALLAAPAVPVSGRQATGTIAGATDEARHPFGDYSVQIRDVASGQIAAAATLSGQGRFSVADLQLSRRFLVELYDTRATRVVCTEGPYLLTSDAPTRTDVVIDCGKAPAAPWLLAASTGTAAAIALTTHSPSQ